MANIQDVAKACGLSVATVSRALNGSTSVLPETAEKVRQAAKMLDYNFLPVRRATRSGKSRAILVVMEEFTNPFFSDILEGMNQAARKQGYHLLIMVTHSQSDRAREALMMLYKKQADGVVFLGSLLPETELVELNKQYPLVLCCEYHEHTALSRVSIDNYLAAYQAVSHMIRMGHKRICMISSLNGAISTVQRERAYIQALKDYHIESEPDILQGTYSYDSGYEKARILLRRVELPFAIFAISDTLAAGALCAVAEQNMLCPRDVAVMGFDNIDMAKMFYPKLSTVNQPRREIGVTAIEMIIERLNGKNECRQVFLPHDLIIRQSV